MGKICISISREYLNEWFSEGFNLIDGKMKNWPDDANFVGAGVNLYTGAGDFIFESKNFPATKEGQRYPNRNIIFTRKHDSMEAELEKGE